jgi:dinuclear metal center YbgI/SA1388 family protein
MKIKEIIDVIEQTIPLQYQESYDNAGLQVGSANDEIKAVLLTVDVTEAVLNEALQVGANLIIAHHPLIFGGVKRLTGKTWTERCLISAIKNNIAIYCAHTNLDVYHRGINHVLAQKLGLQNCKVLDPLQNTLLKLVTYVPVLHVDSVRNALFEAGAGCIGNYDSCSYASEGKGSFRALENTNPFVGEKGKLHLEKEERLEMILPMHLQRAVKQALIKAHPYEEVAFDFIPLANENENLGMGLIGTMETGCEEKDFLEALKNVCKTQAIRHTSFCQKQIQKVAICSGSGISLMNKAIAAGADVFITADVKYHQFFDADGRILLADIGHYESEQWAKEWFNNILTKKITTFAVYFSEINTNPINIY